MALVYLSLGSNLGDRHNYIRKAEILIEKRIGPEIKSSEIYETEPWGTNQLQLFLNKVITIESNLEPLQILEQTQSIEKKLGRIRSNEKYAPRTIDIDILFIDNLVLREKNLIIPHPLIKERRFVLEPFAQIDGQFQHPLLNKTISQLLNDCPDKNFVHKIRS